MAETIVDKQSQSICIPFMILSKGLYYFDYNLDCIFQMDKGNENTYLKFIIKEINNNLEKLLNRKDVYISQEHSKSKWLLTPL